MANATFTSSHMARCEPERKKNPGLEPTSPGVPDWAPPSCVAGPTIFTHHAPKSGSLSLAAFFYSSCESEGRLPRCTAISVKGG